MTVAFLKGFSKQSWALVVTVASIFLLGLVMVYNTSSAEILDRSLSTSVTVALTRQALYCLIGVAAALFVYRLGYQFLLRNSRPLFWLGIFLLLLVFIPGVGRIKNGAHRWIGLSSFTFQPSELIKYLLPIVYIETIRKNKEALNSFFAFAKMSGSLGIAILLVMIEPDNGSAAVMSLALIPLFFLSGVKLRYWALPLAVLAIAATTIALSHPYVRARLEVYWHPEKDLKGKGHQPYQAKIAAGAGQLFGRGPGQSLQKFTYLPEAQNDYIAAIFAEEFGFVGMLALILLYMMFAYLGFVIAWQSVSEAGQLLAMAICFLISLQAFLNLGVASSLLPSKGVNLPFFSQGGTSLIVNFIGVALLLSISNEKKAITF